MRQLFLIILTINSLSSIAQTRSTTRDQVWEILKSNNPDGYELLKRFYELPTDYSFGNYKISMTTSLDFMSFIDDDDLRSILDDVSTAVHEICHMYTDRRAYDLVSKNGMEIDRENPYFVYYLSKEYELLVHQTEVFPTKKIASGIPKELRSMRYDTYVHSSEKILGAQQHGAYGLMDEWTAYYNGFKTTVLNFKSYDPLSKKNNDHWLAYLGDAGSTSLSHYEFKYFILEYLRYAKEQEPTVYSGIIANEAFKNAFHEINEVFTDVLTQHQSNLDFIKESLADTSTKFQLREDYYMLGGTGVGAYEDEINAFKKAMDHSKYDQIKKDLSL